MPFIYMATAEVAAVVAVCFHEAGLDAVAVVPLVLSVCSVIQFAKEIWGSK